MSGQIAAADVRPGLPLDLAITRCLNGEGHDDQRRPYSRSLVAALGCAHTVTDFVLYAERRPGWMGLFGWICDLEWDERDVSAWRVGQGLSPIETPALYTGHGRHEKPAMAICLAVLDMYAVEIVGVPTGTALTHEHGDAE